MKREPSTASRSLRAVSLAITLVVVVALSTFLYSAYADYSGAVGVLGQKTTSPAITAKTVVQGTTTTLYLNATIPNRGLYALSVELSCLPTNVTIKVICNSPSVTVLPGGEDTLRFVMTFEGLNQTSPGTPQVKGDLALKLQSFASMDIVFDLGSLASQGS